MQYDKITAEELLQYGTESVEPSAGWTIATEPPFEPGIAIYIQDDENAVTVADVNLTAARAFAYQILEQVERGLLKQRDAQLTQQLVDNGTLPETAKPFYKPTLKAVD